MTFKEDDFKETSLPVIIWYVILMCLMIFTILINSPFIILFKAIVYYIGISVSLSFFVYDDFIVKLAKTPITKTNSNIIFVMWLMISGIMLYGGFYLTSIMAVITARVLYKINEDIWVKKYEMFERQPKGE